MMKLVRTLILLFIFCGISTITLNAQNKWYVDSAASGNNTGSDWANAFNYLSDATNAARNSTTTDTILVAKGTYYPTGMQSAIDQDSAFIFTRSNLAVLGGYPTGGGMLRDWINNRTVLSGEIGSTNTISDNSYHVVAAIGTNGLPVDNTLILDGFTISGGNASETDTTSAQIINSQVVYRHRGGGIVNFYASPTISNASFNYNATSNIGLGGGIYNIYASPKFVKCFIQANRAYTGGGMYNDSLASPLILNSVISGNNAEFGGGMVNMVADSPNIINTTVTGNTATYGGPAMLNKDLATPSIKNSIFYANGSGTSYGAGIDNWFTGSLPGPMPVFSYSLVHETGGSGGSYWEYIGTDAGHNIDINPNFLTPINITINFVDSLTTEGNFQLQYNSGAINMGDTLGLSQYLPTLDLAANQRIRGNRIDIGAYEFTVSHILYVDSSATAGANNGADWPNAFTKISTATHLARLYTNVDTILVAKGTYYPTGIQSGNNRDSAFIFTRDSLAVLGGYPSGGIGARNSVANATILSGNIGGQNISSDNSYHVVITAGTSSAPLNNTLTLDGFTITGGNANISTGSTTVNSQIISRKNGAGIINFYASPTLSNVTITKDSAIGNGGGIYNFNASPILINGIVNSNTATLNGGGIFDTLSSSPIITNTAISGNSTGGSGGGIFNISASSPKIISTVISGNYAGSNGGGIANNTNAAPFILNTTIAGNFATNFAGGIINQSSSAPIINNTIIYGNNSGIVNVSSSATVSNSIIQAGSPYVGINNNINQNPNFLVPITASSTPSTNGNFQLQYGSPAIDVGDTVGISQYLPAFDKWNNARILGTNVDMGAFEFAVPKHILYVDSSAVAGANNGDSWANAFTTLSMATHLARNFTVIDTILVAKGTYYPAGIQTTANRDSAFIFTRSNLAVLGGYPSGGSLIRNNKSNVTTLSGNVGNANLSSDNSYHVVVVAGKTGTPITNTLTLDGFTIAGGNANATGSIIIDSQTVTKQNGAGISNYYGSPSLLNMIITLDSAIGNGGGIYNYSGSPILKNSILSRNSAIINGGGMYDTLSSSTGLNYCMVNGNSTGNNGGGVYNAGTSPTISSSTITGNYANNTGGGICNQAAAPVVVNVTISGNFATNGGGGIINYSASAPIVKNSIIYANNSGTTDVASSSTISNSIIQDGGYAGTNNNINQNPLFQTPIIASSTASTSGNFQLLYGSPAIGMGDTVGISQYITTKDLAGYSRILGSNIDAGAYEYLNALYVDSSIVVSGKGTSWNDALKYLSDATNTARNLLSIDSILVAKGTYYPTGIQNGTNRDTSFIFTRSGIALLGGYPNGGGMRNWVTNPTILSGDIGLMNDTSGNAYHVLIAVGASSAAPIINFSIDGFTITGGTANVPTGNLTVNGQSVLRNSGGGMQNVNAAPIISDVLITENYGVMGAGISNSNSYSIISNSTISRNKASSQGGGMYCVVTSSALIDNCIIQQNVAATSGGGVYNIGGSTTKLTIINSAIRGNVLTNLTANMNNGGGGIFNTGEIVISNAIISGNKGVNGGGLYNNSNSPANISNTTIAGNTASTNGGGTCWFNSTVIPVMKNCIIYGNSTNLYYNSQASAIFKNSIVQGSGGSGSGWVGTMGVDSGDNKDVNPYFISPASYSLAPDTLGDYSISVCSPGVNAGDTAGISQYLTNTDVKGVSRYNGKIDIGAFEIDTLDVSTLTVPKPSIAEGGTYTSNKIFQQGSLTHFCNCDSNRLLVTLDTTGTGVTFTDTAAKLKIGSSVAAYYQAGSGFVTNPDGTALFNREWSVTPINQPASPVIVYTYYTENDMISVNNALNSLSLTPISSDTQMYFYKVIDTSLGQFPSIFDIGVNQVQLIPHGAAPAINTWVAGTLGNNKYAEYKVTHFSGGGGGASSSGNTAQTGNTPLGTLLLSFEGKVYNNYNLLEWKISEDVTRWELSRSSDATNFEKIAEGEMGITDYKDKKPSAGTNYYRLKIISSAGTATISWVVALDNKKNSNGVSVYPIPSSQIITVSCSNKTLIGQKAVVSDISGKVFSSFILREEVKIGISAWANGIYLIQLPDGNSLKVIKEQ